MWHDCCILAGLERHQTRDCSGCEQRLPWCWTKEAAPCISQQLLVLVFHITCVVLGITLCWCWQCLLTVGGNLLPHIVTTLDVTTVAWGCRQTKDVLHPAECCQQHCKHHSDSGQHVFSLTIIAREVSAVCLLKIGVLSLSMLCRPITPDNLFPHRAVAGVTQTASSFVQLKWWKGCKIYYCVYCTERYH